jgi:hypothetical protein
MMPKLQGQEEWIKRPGLSRTCVRCEVSRDRVAGAFGARARSRALGRVRLAVRVREMSGTRRGGGAQSQGLGSAQGHVPTWGAPHEAGRYWGLVVIGQTRVCGATNVTPHLWGVSLRVVLSRRDRAGWRAWPCL